MQKISILAVFIVLFFSAALHAQAGYQKIWHAVEYYGYRMQDVCQEYILDLDEQGTGKFTVNIRFPSDGEQYQSQFMGLALFTWSQEEEDEEAFIRVTFETLRFTFQELPKYNPYFFQPDHLAYIEEWKQMLAGRELRIEIYSEENRGKVLGMPSLVNSGDIVYLRQGPATGSCDAVRRN
jgi:hypothetical protein